MDARSFCNFIAKLLISWKKLALAVSGVWTKTRAERREGSRLREEVGPMLQKDSAEKSVRDIHRDTRRSLGVLDMTQLLGYTTQ